MNRQSIYKFLLGVTLLLAVGLACSLTDSIDQLREGKEAIETVQGIATQIDESGLVETGQAMATKVDESGLSETAQALVTEVDESGIAETVQAMATELVVQPGDVPADVPIWEGNKTAFVGSDQVISYSTNDSFQELLNFYEREMIARGWTKIQLGTVISDTSADLHYEKDGRKVNVIIQKLPIVNMVSVVINFE